MKGSPGRILLILEAAVSCNGTGLYPRFHQSFLVVMVGGVSPAKMSREKASMWISSVVLLAYEEGSFSMPQRTLMWHVGSSMMTRRAGLYCRSKDATMFILYNLVAPP